MVPVVVQRESATARINPPCVVPVVNLDVAVVIPSSSSRAPGSPIRIIRESDSAGRRLLRSAISDKNCVSSSASQFLSTSEAMGCTMSAMRSGQIALYALLGAFIPARSGSFYSIARKSIGAPLAFRRREVPAESPRQRRPIPTRYLRPVV